ncbi:surfeit locus 1 family protein [Roseateles sp. YR242]|uniref:SURF1 family protein n=1 Tax=Roseateles sp. YR242 TaxID=1855305 RepID=UPI0008D157B9|nr:SURF1 family protein [Roseateles sp. YR242]SEK94200.1 surfeit locus 1 family protein [Roseateles sp. YR242]
MADLPQERPRRRIALWALQLGAALLFVGFVALGSWQVQRLGWKQDLIARVEKRLAAPPVLAPGASRWEGVNKAEDEYRRVFVRGAFDHSREVLVGASTELGTGYWVLTPLRSTDGNWVLVNRGFVPPEYKARVSRTATEAQGEVVVQGLLRLTEPGGSLLRKNEPATGRWFSRDVQAIGKAQALEGPLAPYFIDEADMRPVPKAETSPRGGLTVVRFPNSHLSYALTWFAMAAMTAGIVIYLWRDRRRRERAGVDDRASEPA